MEVIAGCLAWCTLTVSGILIPFNAHPLSKMRYMVEQEKDTWQEIQRFRKKHRGRMQTIWKKKIRRRRSSVTEIPQQWQNSHHVRPIDKAVEHKVHEALLNPTLEFPMDVTKLIVKIGGSGHSKENDAKEILNKMNCQGLVELQDGIASSINLDRLSKLVNANGTAPNDESPISKKFRTTGEEIDWILTSSSVKEKESKKMGNEILDLLNTKSFMEQRSLEMFQSAGGSQLREFCLHKTKDDCRRARNSSKACAKLHFRRIIQAHTDKNLGDCSFLNTCFHMETCKFVHYSIDDSIDEPEALPKQVKAKPTVGGVVPRSKLISPQWVNCDLRYFDMSCLGKFAVIMADPPWDIHMELPYGTMSDDEMRQLNIPGLQDDGYIFLWVTGRAMELGRECLTLWGYERVDELVWVKTNQLQRLIRTGRTGHWINHGKEHCLVGAKGNLAVNRGIDTDVIVAEVRATSHKPDEVYGLIERLSPGTLKIELFGRQHNCQPNWVTLGNQLDGVKLIVPNVKESFFKRYPRGDYDTMAPPTNLNVPKL